MLFLTETHNTGDPTPYLQAERARIYELLQAGIVETVLLKADRSGAIVLLRAADEAAARDALSSLPLVANGITSFGELTEVISAEEARSAPQTGTASASQLPALFGKYFAARAAQDVEGTLAYLSPDLITYTDATLGMALDSYAAVKAGFEQYMPTWAPPARSYPTKILAGSESALVHLVDTPEMFGGELRILAAVDFADGKIVRWIDYWDASAYDAGLYGQMRAPADRFPRDMQESKVATTAPAELTRAAAALHKAFTAPDASAAAAAMHTDVVFTDMALRTQVIGRIETVRYLERVLGRVPYGQGSVLRHVVGGAGGGGFEWTAGPDADQLVGITALELDADGLITAITLVYDSRQIDPATKRALLEASFA
jgi:ketosteroid isomerase-like protein